MMQSPFVGDIEWVDRGRRSEWKEYFVNGVYKQKATKRTSLSPTLS